MQPPWPHRAGHAEDRIGLAVSLDTAPRDRAWPGQVLMRGSISRSLLCPVERNRGMCLKWCAAPTAKHRFPADSWKLPQTALLPASQARWRKEDPEQMFKAREFKCARPSAPGSDRLPLLRVPIVAGADGGNAVQSADGAYLCSTRCKSAWSSKPMVIKTGLEGRTMSC